MFVINQDCIEGMRELPDNSIDAIVTDPPYELGFMGKSWDASGIAYRVELWAECLRVLKPGGHMLAFSGSRTYHRMTCAIEDAGFEIRDQIMWVYSSGFPKSFNLNREKGKTFCGCSTDTVPYTHEERTKPQTECDVRPMSNTDVSTSEPLNEERGEILQYGLSQQSTPIEGRPEFSPSEIWGVESCMERGSDGFQEKRKLQRHSILEGTRVDEAYGPERWLHNGAPQSDGGMGGASTHSNGGGASRQSQSSRESTVESATMAGQPQPQVIRTWPLCRGCGKHVIPDGFGTSLKPAHEPICVARKPLIGTVAQNVLTHGTGALNIDGCRVGIDGGTTRSGQAPYAESGWRTGYEVVPLNLGRWPANLIHDGSDEVVELFPREAGAAAPVKGTEPSAVTAGIYGEFAERIEGTFYGDSGSAARFFYCAKSSKRDRDEGLEDFEIKTAGGMSGRNDGSMGSITRRANHHPTVKPTQLMRYLCRLITPPGGTILDPFTGSGSTGKAAILEGFAFIGFEQSAEYTEIANARITHALLTNPVNKT